MSDLSQTDLVDIALQEGAQAIRTAPDFPPGKLPEILAAIQGPAVRAALEMRIGQIAQGHDAEHDSFLPIEQLPHLARQFGLAAIEQLTGTRERQNLPVARKNLARMAAAALAAIDRLDMVLNKQLRDEGSD